MVNVQRNSHPPYSPDLALSDFHFFLHLKKHLAGENFDDDDEVQEEVMTWFRGQAADFYDSGIKTLVPRLNSNVRPSTEHKIAMENDSFIYVPWVFGETWSITFREERRLRVFQNRVLRRIFEPKRDGVTGECRKLHNEELNDLYCSPNIIRVIKWKRMR
jgi:phage pi2 protein 07